MAPALTLLERYQKHEDKFLSHFITGDETWVTLVNVKTKEQTKQWVHTHSTNKSKNLNKSCLPES
jgi:hypothetical protein